MEKPYFLTPKKLLENFKVDEENGLTQEQVIHNRVKFGVNELPPPEREGLFTLVLRQFEDRLVQILLGSMIISVILAFFEEKEEQLTAFFEPLTILVILVANATIGVFQERSAGNAVEALQKFQADIATVVRDGVGSTISPKDVVVGDIIDVVVGEKVPADARILSILSTILRVEESILTGESESVTKDIDELPVRKDLVILQEQKNMLFSGTNITRGKARCMVTSVGKDTEVGKIQKQMTDAERVRSPMEIKMEEFAALLTKLIMGVCIFVWVVNYPNFYYAGKGNSIRGALVYFKIAVSLAVAAIPEGLPAVITTCYSIGVSRLAKKNAIMVSLPSVETLGCTSVICTDKTGTLTTNQMTVVRSSFLVKGRAQVWDVNGESYLPEGTIMEDGTENVIEKPAANHACFAWMSKVGQLCNDANLQYDEKEGRFDKIGEPTEASLVVFGEKLGFPDKDAEDARLGKPVMHRFKDVKTHWEKVFQKKATLEFSRDRKSMSVWCQDRKTKKHYLFVKGAYERVVARCSHAMLDDESVVPLKKNGPVWKSLEDLQKRWAAESLRCLALAYVEYDGVPDFDLDDSKKFEEYESNMTFVGAVGIMDPPRKEVIPAIADCKKAHIRVIMCTGDNIHTAVAICRKIGIMDKDEDIAGKAFTGSEFEKMSDAELDDAARNAKCFARVEPAHKQRLVGVLQKQKEVVAMTGDGINDSPALVSADIGVAMGSGTSVARNAAKMILLDDNFATIVGAVDEGRAIFNNTKSFIRYLITSNIGEVVAVAVAALAGLPEVLLSVQLLFVNLVTDGLPASALGFNKAESNVMSLPPRKKDEPIVNRQSFLRYLIGGTYVGLAVIAATLYWYLLDPSGPMITFHELRNHHKCVGERCAIFENPVPQTMSLSVLVVVEMLCALSSVSDSQSLLVIPPWSNVYLVFAALGSMIMHFVVLEIDFFNKVFSTTHLGLQQWIVVLAICFPAVLVEEFFKYSIRKSIAATEVEKSKKD
eukprot:TRINITY_DN975_c2_g1_i1.p1 TRINITY_DN975_c2_g1~~TRINITY_DN975_c2_g1_i1.p1  ORF type:complete len:995 (-),score=300.54 TRINITY_DN975_c2_g1_i1:2713-5697(-)